MQKKHPLCLWLASRKPHHVPVVVVVVAAALLSTSCENVSLLMLMSRVVSTKVHYLYYLRIHGPHIQIYYNINLIRLMGNILCLYAKSIFFLRTTIWDNLTRRLVRLIVVRFVVVFGALLLIT